MLTLYQDPRSGNCYKAILCASYLDIPIKTVSVDVVRGQTRTDQFLAKNPNGRVPALELENGTVLAESNAIIWYLARGTKLIPDDRLSEAQMLQWMFFEQYSHEPYIAVARYWRVFASEAQRKQKEHLFAEWSAKGHAALKVMERHLVHNDWFVSRHYSLADIALFGYTHVAHEGGFDLSDYPHIEAWLARVRGSPRFRPMGAD